MDDSPTSVSHFHRIIDLFPDSKFILIERNLSDVQKSYHNSSWGKRLSRKHEMICINNVLAFNESFDSNLILKISFDSLVSRSKQSSEVSKLEDFLQVSIPQDAIKLIDIRNGCFV